MTDRPKDYRRSKWWYTCAWCKKQWMGNFNVRKCPRCLGKAKRDKRVEL